MICRARKVVENRCFEGVFSARKQVILFASSFASSFESSRLISYPRFNRIRCYLLASKFRALIILLFILLLINTIAIRNNVSEVYVNLIVIN